ncbi:glycoside hydrolase family 18 protein [Allonocardiopsis opalescens]|uniref:Glycosyl hydrolase family 18 (Putative chitinase) n=1 Tax=Allonocardiopsis opalescens TaxID=1144618 RepID=A0A2T0QFH8_9ACTN|nr:glycoside hydrolase family 18 protein [Allonocardiopsis opalescens]PRY02679.1 glycosyl hydrolase family 18 (putative chitinase) [Allonocardiopsis opalescens]
MKWLLQRVLAAIAAVLVVAVAGGVLIQMQFTGEPTEWARSNGGNALWMGHAWVDGRNGQAELDALAPRISAGQISDVYVHVGPLELDGSLDAGLYPGAEDFLRRFREALPDVRVSAWVGQRVEAGRLDLSDDETRERIVAAASQVVDAGFDGVHYNFEPVNNNDRSLLDLLDATREEIGDDALLSSAVPQVEPLAGLNFPIQLVTGKSKYWSTGYLTEVAERLDQVAVMAYDTAMPMEGLYGGFVVRQTRLALEAVPEDVQLLMGVPAYPDDHATRNPEAETTETSTRAIRLGLSSLPEPRERFGTALYVDFTATPEQWAAYQEGWVLPE